jgi:hypothetical protein
MCGAWTGDYSYHVIEQRKSTIAELCNEADEVGCVAHNALSRCIVAGKVIFPTNPKQQSDDGDCDRAIAATPALSAIVSAAFICGAV